MPSRILVRASAPSLRSEALAWCIYRLTLNQYCAVLMELPRGVPWISDAGKDARADHSTMVLGAEFDWL